MRRIDLLLAEARQETDNKEFTDETGIQDSELLRWANSAQTRILSLIHQNHPDVLEEESTFAGVLGQEQYDIPAHTFMKTRMKSLWYSRTGQTTDYYLLKKGSMKERLFSTNGSPVFYIRQSDKVLIQPQPDTTGVFKILYQKELPRLDIRRGTVSSVTLDTVDRNVDSLILDNTVNIDAEEIQAEGWISIVDFYGNIKMEGIPVTEANSETGVITIAPGFVYNEGDTIEVGDYVVLGKYSSTDSDLPDICERYIVDFMIWKLEKRDSNMKSPELSEELVAQEVDIIASFAEADQDVKGVTILDNQYLDPYTRNF